MSDFDRISEEIFSEAGLVLEEQLKNFLVTAKLNMTGVPAWVKATSAVFSAKINERALGEHAEALIEAAKASDRHASSLVWATRILAAATIALVIATLVLAFRR